MQLHWLNDDERIEAFGFYKKFMPHARLTKKEKLGVFFAENSASKPIIAAVRLRPIGSYQLLTGILVHPGNRGQGVGHQLMQALKPHLESAPSFLFSLPHLRNFYQQHQFEGDRQAPAEIRDLFSRYTREGKSLYLMCHSSNEP
ncbi:GNAT family N-acetyltransferase [Shewanella sp. Isolate11]|uniref:GNAT family N-acetyltransferase n=1 Tax=Shewanella sp. Isolate11 TaxID=2908530 RepID=UPI001EFE07DB|nr:GNAT family N-acetyltransferase [Shewanella sp. Isolate11]MCG9697307.1 GNAT family N-acetyltransferase [Shewanella sp. Isolate11]